MDYFWRFILFVFGLAIGSFLNVVALRYRPGQKLFDLKVIGGRAERDHSPAQRGGRSKCPVCHKTLAWYELMPIFSFLIQKRKCRHCGNLISLQYPLVEILSGLIFVFVPLVLVASGYTIAAILIWILIFLLFLLLSIIDFRQYIIPDSINLSLAVLGGLLVIASGAKQSYGQSSFLGYYASLFDFSFFNLSIFQSFNLSILINHFFAALIAMVFFGAIILLTKGKAMGLGDFKLVGSLGLIFGWPDILMILFLAFIIGAAFSIVLLVGKKKKMKEAVPFGPFLAIGASLTFFFGYQIIDGYFKLFGL